MRQLPALNLAFVVPLLVPLAGCPGCSDPPAAEGEGEGEGEGDLDGNSRDNPGTLALPGSTETDLAVEDEDCFNITVPAGNPVDLTVETSSADCTATDTVLRVYDANGTLLEDGALNDDISNPANRCSRAVARVHPGVYTVCVTEFLQDAALTGITLTSSSVAATAVPLHGTCTSADLCDVGLQCVDLLGSTDSTCETAPVDEAGGRAAPKVVTLPMNESFVLFGANDADCYSFDLADAAAFTFATSNPCSGDLELVLYAADGTFLTSVDNNGDNEGETMTEADLDETVAAGTHVLCVYEYYGYTTGSNTLTGQLN